MNVNLNFNLEIRNVIGAEVTIEPIFTGLSGNCGKCES
jgi:hypothetical protein